MKTRTLISPETTREISILAEIATYGANWNDGSEEFSAYIQGSAEATAFIIACCMTQ
jgi:hypothetical protein